MGAWLSPKKRAITSLSEPENPILKLGEPTEVQLPHEILLSATFPLPYFTDTLGILNYKLLRDHEVLIPSHHQASSMIPAILMDLLGTCILDSIPTVTGGNANGLNPRHLILYEMHNNYFYSNFSS